MFKKLNKKGFTLAELLVVVAIIGVLVAVSIPIFTAQLEKAREATDLANMRAAKAVAVAEYLEDDSATWKAKFYDAGKGTLVADAPKGYGKGTKTVGNTTNEEIGYLPGQDYVGKVIKVTGVTKDGGVAMEWVAGATA